MPVGRSTLLIFDGSPAPIILELRVQRFSGVSETPRLGEKTTVDLDSASSLLLLYPSASSLQACFV